MNKKIYTIGYTAFQIKEFIFTLKMYNINCLIDVRSSPYSKNYPDYNKNVLEKTLNISNIIYRNYKYEFGARQTDTSFYTQFEDFSYLDFSKFIISKQFNIGVNNIVKGINIGYNICLMCAETNPVDCHRSIMVGRGLKAKGFDVCHILKDKNIKSQNDIENELLEYYYNDRNQVKFFSESKDDDFYIKEAYTKKNIEIGFRKDDEE